MLGARSLEIEVKPLELRRADALVEAALLAAEYPDAKSDLDYEDAFTLLVATVLSAQTTDVRVNQVTPHLFSKWRTPSALAAADLEEVEETLRPLGMFRRKARAIVDLANRVSEDHGNEVPGTRQELVALPGVGRKTANVVLGNWFGAQEISVDTHVARVTWRLGWVNSKNPVVIERQLWELLPDADWTKLSHRLIYHGRIVCHARKPDCDACVLVSLCPWFKDSRAT